MIKVWISHTGWLFQQGVRTWYKVLCRSLIQNWDTTVCWTVTNTEGVAYNDSGVIINYYIEQQQKWTQLEIEEGGDFSHIPEFFIFHTCTCKKIYFLDFLLPPIEKLPGFAPVLELRLPFLHISTLSASNKVTFTTCTYLHLCTRIWGSLPAPQ